MNIHIEKKINSRFTLDATGSWGKTEHFLDKETAYAIIAAVNAGRPLLVCGEPGVGKSQLARAAAYLLERKFISTVVQPNSDYEEMLWSFDHTSRLADAQLSSSETENAKVKDPRNYIAPGALWYALDWEKAEKKRCKNNFHAPKDISREDVEKQGLVLLIDEIDKADISLSNGLLEVLGNGGFSVPPLGETVPDKSTKTKTPFIVLTSNDTRQLPDALRRRCVVLKLELPESEDELIDHLVTIGETHFTGINNAVLEEAAKQIVEDRRVCQGQQKTGQAEYLDLLRALEKISNNEAGQLSWLSKIADCFKKS